MQSTKSLSTEKRLAALENFTAPDMPKVRILRFVAARNGQALERDPIGYTTQEGLRWDRLHGEDREVFRERVTLEAQQSGSSAPVLVEEYA